jgi:hypothetical protein
MESSLAEGARANDARSEKVSHLHINPHLNFASGRGVEAPTGPASIDSLKGPVMRNLLRGPV